MPINYDAIVLGTGGMGSAVLHELARRGRRVLALDRFTPGHSRGSSHGQTRVIREAYFEHPGYVPLARRAYERWFDLEQLTGRHLLTECGCLSTGPAEGELVAGVLRSAAEHAIPVESLKADDLRRRYPAFKFGDEFVGVYERRGGYLAVEECVKAHCEAALASGAIIHPDEPAEKWEPVGNLVAVQTWKDTYYAAKLVVTAGAWAAELLDGIGVPLSIMRQVMLWHPPTEPELFRRDRFPVFLAEVPGGPFYGLPMIDPRGIKVARHYGAAELKSPTEVDWSTSPADAVPTRWFLRRHLPGADAPPSAAQVCMYTLSPDRHFVIDCHPLYPQVVFAAGFSGHGFKFASAIGEILADLADSGETPHDISLFRASRFV